MQQGGNMFEYTGGESSRLTEGGEWPANYYPPKENNGVDPNDAPNPLLGTGLKNPVNGIKSGGVDPGVHGEGRSGSMAATLGNSGVPSGQQALPSFTNTGFPIEKQTLLYKPNRPTSNVNRIGTGSPRKKQLPIVKHNDGAIAPCYAISCADGLADNPALKQYINSVTLAIQSSDPQATTIDLETLEANQEDLDPFRKREQSLLAMQSCDALICCIPKQCSLERWLRAVIEAREMFMNGCCVLGLVDPHENIPEIFLQCTTKIFTDMFELERYVSTRSRRRAIAARNAAAGR